MLSRKRTIAASITVLLPIGLIRLARGQFDTYRVRGESMRPTLEPGDVLVGFKLREGPLARVSSPSTGDIVVAVTPWEPETISIKRAVARPGEPWMEGDDHVPQGDGWALVGDQRTLSTDSRQHGRVPEAAIIASVVYRLSPRERRGML